MGQPKKGEIKLTVKEVHELALEMEKWMYDNPDEFLLKKFSASKKIPFSYFTNIFPRQSNLFKEKLELCQDLIEARYWDAVKDGNIPQTFGIFGAKNLLGYRDRQESSDKDKPKEVPTKQLTKDAIKKAKDRFFDKPE